MSKVTPRHSGGGGGWMCRKCSRFNSDDSQRRCNSCLTWRNLDWQCTACGYSNFAKRSTCNVCGTEGGPAEEAVPVPPVSLTYPELQPYKDVNVAGVGGVAMAGVGAVAGAGAGDLTGGSDGHPWLCGICQIENTPRRIVCFECSGHRERVEVRNRKYDVGGRYTGHAGAGYGRFEAAPVEVPGYSTRPGAGNDFHGDPAPTPRYEDMSGDWLCGECDNRNFAKRYKCNRCHKLKEEVEVKGATFENEKPRLAPSRSAPPPPPLMPPPRRRSYQEALGGGNGARPEDRSRDWACSNCSNRNFAKRTKCNTCDKPREEVEDTSIQYDQELGSRNQAPRYQPPRITGHTLSFRQSYVEPPPKRRKWVDEDKSNDWQCKFCDINNFVKRSKCFKCSRNKEECMVVTAPDEGKDIIKSTENIPAELSPLM